MVKSMTTDNPFQFGLEMLKSVKKCDEMLDSLNNFKLYEVFLQVES